MEEIDPFVLDDSCSRRILARCTWWPDPLSRRFRCGARLRRKSDANDTGATTQGPCIAFNNVATDCLTAETILFLVGSTLEFQGIERRGAPSARSIVGGSGRYLGAIGTLVAVPSTDLLLWTKTIESAAPSGQ
jgi:hypothetical protein